MAKKNAFGNTEFMEGSIFSLICSLPALFDRARGPIARVGLRFAVWGFLGIGGVAEALAQAAEPLRVEAKIAPGAYVVGQGIELRLSMIGSERPQIDPFRIDGARAWKVGTKARTIGKTAIGSITAEESVFVVSFRVVAQRSGPLEIPRIRARIGARTGQSQPIRLAIGAVPLSGRTAEFLGGVGQFTLAAEASPRVVRVGQELDYRIKVTGPAAWAMNGHPELSRFSRLGLGLRIESKPDELTDEPPERTFVYRLRPTKASEAVLPPVAIAAFDPRLSEYVTRVTSSVPIRVVAIPAFDPASIDSDVGKNNSARSAWAVWVLSGVLLVSTSAMLVWVRRRTHRRRLLGPAAARRYAARLARSYLCVDSGNGRSGGSSALTTSNADVGTVADDDAAHRVSDELMHYLEIGLGRPTGALTPDEAWLGVRDLTGSHDLARQAGRLTARCDRALYGDQPGAGRVHDLRENARMLFEALGRAGTSHNRAR
jgi:hypothetical protein